MRNFVGTSLIVVCGLALAGLAHSQSLAEVAKKEKARRAKIAQEKKAAEVVDGHSLRQVKSNSFTAVEVTGAPERRSSLSGSTRPVPTNPNRPPAETSSTEKKSTSSPMSVSPPPPPRAGNTETGRGWSSHDSGPTTGRGWDHRRKEILEGMGRTITPVHPTTVQERDRQQGRQY